MNRLYVKYFESWARQWVRTMEKSARYSENLRISSAYMHGGYFHSGISNVPLVIPESLKAFERKSNPSLTVTLTLTFRGASTPSLHSLFCILTFKQELQQSVRSSMLSHQLNKNSGPCFISCFSAFFSFYLVSCKKKREILTHERKYVSFLHTCIHPTFTMQRTSFLSLPLV